MSTLAVTAKNSSLMYDLAAKGLSANPSSKFSYAAQLSAPKTEQAQMNSFLSTINNKSQLFAPKKASASLFGGDNSSSGLLSALNENKAALNDVTKSYTQVSKTFATEYKSTMSDLKESSKKLAATDFNVKGKTDKETDDNVKTALKNVNTFVKDYNETVSFFTDYANLGKRLNNMSSLFADNSSRANSLNEIGIKVDKETGKLSVDSEKLTKAMKETPSRVEYQLGDYGLAGKAESKMNVANSQQSQLMPTLQELAGDSYTNSQALYNSNYLAMINQYNTIGQNINMFF